MNLKAIFSGLTPEQEKAVTTLKGPLLIIAGAGSGKTRVITHRIAHLIQHQVPAEQILAITFTNKATSEMKQRISHSAQGEKVWVSTFHAFCARILRRHAHHLGYSRHYLIYDTDDKKALIQEIAKEKKIHGVSLGQLSGWISEVKQKVRYFDQTLSLPSPLDEIFPYYQERLKRADAMDFEDLLNYTLLLLDTAPEVLQYYQNFFQYISVDEYQDTNEIQAELMFRLAELHHNICVCGDPNQSIYAFRGAKIENILQFHEHYPETQIVKLEENFRSTRTILELASQVIAQNPQPLPFRSYTKNEDGSLVQLYICRNEQAESSLLAKLIQHFQEKNYSLKDIAIFYRINAQSRQIENSLVLQRIPYQIVGGTTFYQRKEVKDLLAYLRFTINPLDEMSLLRILNLPPRGLGKTTLEKIKKLAEEEQQSLYWALQHSSRISLKKKALDALDHFLQLIETLKTLAQEHIYETLTYLIEEINYRQYLSHPEEHSSISRKRILTNYFMQP